MLSAARPTPLRPIKPEETTMQQLFPDLWQTAAQYPFGPAVTTHAYLWLRADGNVLFYNTGLTAELDAIERLGGVAWQYLSHRDEVAPSLADIRQRFGARLCCHALEAPFAGRVSPVDVSLRCSAHTPGRPGCDPHARPHARQHLLPRSLGARTRRTCSPATRCSRTAPAGAPTSPPRSATPCGKAWRCCAIRRRTWCCRPRPAIRTATVA